jgi:nitrogen PTS system EIIA component
MPSGDAQEEIMSLIEMLSPAAVLTTLRPTSKKQLLEMLAAQASSICGLEERHVFDALLQRERLGSTGIGNGIAIPHGKFTGLDRLVGLFAKLAKPVDFEALDNQPVDLVFVLLAPEGAGADHLKGLSRIARVLRDPLVTAQVRAAREADVVHALLTRPPAASIAA